MTRGEVLPQQTPSVSGRAQLRRRSLLRSSGRHLALDKTGVATCTAKYPSGTHSPTMLSSSPPFGSDPIATLPGTEECRDSWGGRLSTRSVVRTPRRGSMGRLDLLLEYQRPRTLIVGHLALTRCRYGGMASSKQNIEERRDILILLQD